MGSAGRRSVFVGALCTGVAMLGISVHGLLGVDADLQRSAYAARVVQQHNLVEYHSARALPHHGDCNQYAPPPGSRTRT
jgi:hypothetical protein